MNLDGVSTINDRQPDTRVYLDAVLTFQAWCAHLERPFRQSMIEAMLAYRLMNGDTRQDEPAGRPGHPLDGLGRGAGRKRALVRADAGIPRQA